MRCFKLVFCLMTFVNMAQANCQPVDFMTLPLPQTGDPVEIALEAAYPGADLDLAAGTFRSPDGIVIPVAPARDVGPAARLNGATLGDMFTYVYPLDFDLTSRRTAWFDPGRVRDEAFFQALYFDSQASAAASLATAAVSTGGSSQAPTDCRAIALALRLT